jgi:hypothetical protein
MRALLAGALIAFAALTGTAATAHADPYAGCDNPSHPAWYNCPIRTPYQQHQDDTKRGLCKYMRDQYPEDCAGW